MQLIQSTTFGPNCSALMIIGAPAFAAYWSIEPLSPPSWLRSASSMAPSSHEIGRENVGFMPFPEVDGGKGSIDQYAANAGAPMIINAEQFGPKVVDWISCIVENYGEQALQDAGVISGVEV